MRCAPGAPIRRGKVLATRGPGARQAAAAANTKRGNPGLPRLAGFTYPGTRRMIMLTKERSLREAEGRSHRGSVVWHTSKTVIEP